MRYFHQISQQACLQRFVAVYRQGYSFLSTCLDVDVMAAVNSFQFPAFLTEHFSEILSTDLLQTLISISSSPF